MSFHALHPILTGSGNPRKSQCYALTKDVKTMVLSSLLSSGTSASSLVDQVTFLLGFELALTNLVQSLYLEACDGY